MKTHVNITDSFEYLAEESKVKFQHHIGSLQELQQYLRDKVTNGKNPEAIFFDAGELATIDEWFSTIVIELLTDYEIINRSQRFAQANYNIASEILRRTPNLKSLLKA